MVQRFSRRRRQTQSSKDASHTPPLLSQSMRGERKGPKHSDIGSSQPIKPSSLDLLGSSSRVAKVIARAGLCSRRDAERWIEEGRVHVNGRLLTTPALDITSKDVVSVDGTPLPSATPAQVWCYHKPKGLVTTHKDPQGRPTVFENLPPFLPRVISVGRLDFNTEGLLLLTNDGALARFLELPSSGWLRRYRVRARGRVTPKDLERLSEGVRVEKVKYGPVEASIDSVQGANTWLTLGIREGKNREIRKILEALGLTVSRLIRISFGPFELGSLAPGQVESVSHRQLSDLLKAHHTSKKKVPQDLSNDEQEPRARKVIS